MKTRYIVTVWYHQSETSYTFGPFSEGTLLGFLARIEADTNCGEPTVSVLNPPRLLGTGYEESVAF